MKKQEKSAFHLGAAPLQPRHLVSPLHSPEIAIRHRHAARGLLGGARTGRYPGVEPHAQLVVILGELTQRPQHGLMRGANHLGDDGCFSGFATPWVGTTFDLQSADHSLTLVILQRDHNHVPARQVPAEHHEAMCHAANIRSMREGRNVRAAGAGNILPLLTPFPESPVLRFSTTLAAAFLLAACATKKEEPASGASDTAATTPTAEMDADPATGGSGVPSGYIGRTDRESAKIAEAKYVPSGANWEVTTGPAHIVYADKDAATGNYTATATFQQMEKPTHPEAFGLFVGGANLDQPTQQYTYFLVRGGGEYLIKVREGGNTREVAGWTKSAMVPTEDAAGKGTYKLAIRVDGAKVSFLVNDKEVRNVPRQGLPTDGIAGLRINHNLHLLVAPLGIVRP